MTDRLKQLIVTRRPTLNVDLGLGPPVPAFLDFGSREWGQPNFKRIKSMARC